MDFIIFYSNNKLIRTLICLLFPLFLAFSLTCASFSISANYDAGIDYLARYIQNQNPEYLEVDFERDRVKKVFLQIVINIQKMKKRKHNKV